MMTYQLAQVNVGRFRAPIDDPIMDGFRNALDPDVLAKVSHGLGEPMPGLDIREIGEDRLLQTRGW